MKVGFGKSSITPKGGKIVIAGRIPVRYTDVVHDDVQAVAMVVEQNDTRTIWVGCDMCHPTKRLTDDVIAGLKNSLPDFKEDELILSATHATACFYLTDDEFGNAAFDVDLDEIMSVDETRRQVCSGIIAAVMEAVSNIEECTVEYATSDILTGFCRRVVYKDGSAAMYGDVHREDFLRMEYPDGGGMQIIYFYSRKNRQLFGIFAAVPCPAQADESSEYITADYWAVVRERIAEEYGDGINVLGVCRAAGELSPHRMIKTDGGSRADEWGYDAARRMGMHIADAIIKESKRPVCVLDETEISHSRITKEIAFPIRKPSQNEVDEATLYFQNKANFDENGNAIKWIERATAGHILKVWNGKQDIYKGRVSVMNIGKLLFFTAPVELFTEYAKRICVKFPGHPVFDIQLTNDSLGYLPTKEAIEHGGYSTLIFSTTTSAEGGEIYVDEITKLMKELMQ